MNLHSVRLCVNIDHVATVRQARRTVEPDPAAAAVLAILGGADGITVHLREDRRHIQDRDVRSIRETIPQRLNLEMATCEDIIKLACDVRPDEVTLVPEKREELTTEGGLNVVANQSAVASAVERLQAVGIAVAVFVDPDAKQIEAVQAVGATAVEIQTATYSEARGEPARQAELTHLRGASKVAADLGLAIHLGHGLTYWNVQPVVRIQGVQELNIGHSIVSRAVLVGMERAVREMKDAIRLA